MSNHKIYFCLVFCCIFANFDAKSYRPVAVIHGILTGDDSMEEITNHIQEMHPGTLINNTGRYSGWSSLDPMWKQVEEVGKDILAFGAQFPDGINLLGYSQGGLLARAILQRFPEHNVKNFISLSSPQAGQYGTRFLHLIFPDLFCETAYELFYSRLGQHTSVGNYWNDPHHQELYYKYSTFLPLINNEKYFNSTINLKAGITKLDKMVLIGGPDDGVITPWQSAHFGYYDGNETVVELRDRETYRDDLIGLKTLDKKKKLIILSVPGISHYDWHTNVSIVDHFLLPYLN
ncbi:lysosomal thioesterase PPT2 homolog [Leptopilina heterotoma]|uniref:lysosomal thioesterase PPT2 homolog n=1 Tax=Leptopilina heterotoma TaxID=63436 RepID=UPI001CA7C702|nr:lysosomal thioesterase PPT2 homolog [Leptopilina heterotoma]